MDLGRIRALGYSRTRKAWVTNPLRDGLWRLLLPFFQGMAVETDRRAELQGAELQRAVADLERRLRADLTSLLTSMQQNAAASVASQLAGARKDTLALAHRLAGLEEEAAAHAGTAAQLAVLRHDVRTSGLAVTERLDKLNEQAERALNEATDAAAYVASLHQEVRALDQARAERMDRLGEQAELALTEATGAAAQAREAAAYVSAVHQEVRDFDQARTERMDILTEQTRMALGEANSAAAQAREAATYIVSLHRDRALRPGDRLPLGQAGLTLAETDAGSRFLVRQHDLIGGLVAEGREWEPHVRAAIARAARPDGVAVDAGAYIGLHTVTMSRWFGSVHAFEPQRGVYQVLCGNLALNDCANVEAHNLALYDRAGSMRLAPAERQEVALPLCDGQPDYGQIANAAALTFEVAAEGAGDVHSVALDDLGLERVALIKVDTQGADLKVLRGAEATIRRCRPSVLFEWERELSAHHGDSIQDYHAFFAGLEYDLTVLQETSPGRQVDYLATPR